MKKIYLVLFTFALSAAAIGQTISIGTSTALPPEGGSTNTFRSPWCPAWGYSYVQTIYLKTEINTMGTISSLRFNYGGTSLTNSNQITVWMGSISRSVFASTSDWEPTANMTQVFSGTVSYTTLPGIVTVNLTTPFTYNNTGNLVIAIHDAKADFDDSYFYASEMGTARTIYRVDDEADPNPAAPPTADNIRTKVGNIQIVFGTTQPVTLSNFSGQKNGSANKLSWLTETEQNSKGFDVQRSADGTSFTSIGFVKSKAENGSSNGGLLYAFDDNQPLAGNNYYRLVQTDLDGKTTISKVIMLKGAPAALTLSAIYPNPATNDLNIILSSNGNSKAMLYISDVSGKVIYKTTFSTISGDNKIHINPSGFAKGIYTIKAVYEASKESVVTKFVKQ